jgi:hypothetical protein
MSRTKRYIPEYYQRVSPHVLTWAGLGELHRLEQDQRCALSNGRDHCQQSYVNENPKGIGNKCRGWSELFVGDARVYLKRLKAKRSRSFAKTQIQLELLDL